MCTLYLWLVDYLNIAEVFFRLQVKRIALQVGRRSWRLEKEVDCEM